MTHLLTTIELLAELESRGMDVSASLHNAYTKAYDSIISGVVNGGPLRKPHKRGQKEAQPSVHPAWRMPKQKPNGWDFYGLK